MFPDAIPVENELYVSDSGILTCPGGTAAIDLAVGLLIEHCGRSRGMKGLTAMVVDEHRTAHEVGRLPFQDLEECGNWRVEQAIKMIADEARSLGDIAHACGFSDQAHFTRLFKRFTGQTPRQYRAGQT